jgi:hypothetical protein
MRGMAQTRGFSYQSGWLSDCMLPLPGVLLCGALVVWRPPSSIASASEADNTLPAPMLYGSPSLPTVTMRYAIAATALLGMSVGGATASCQGPALSSFQAYLARFGKSYSDEREFQQRCAHFLKVSMTTLPLPRPTLALTGWASWLVCRGQASWRATTRWLTPPPPRPSRYVHPPHAGWLKAVRRTRVIMQSGPTAVMQRLTFSSVAGPQVGLNKFSDWSEDEITQLMGDRVDSAVEAQLRPFDLSSLSGSAPRGSVDYRDGNNSFGKPGLTPIKVGRSRRMKPDGCLTGAGADLQDLGVWPPVADAHDC